jgi:hypothetical protein
LSDAKGLIYHYPDEIAYVFARVFIEVKLGRSKEAKDLEHVLTLSIKARWNSGYLGGSVGCAICSGALAGITCSGSAGGVKCLELGYRLYGDH